MGACPRHARRGVVRGPFWPTVLGTLHADVGYNGEQGAESYVDLRMSDVAPPTHEATDAAIFVQTAVIPTRITDGGGDKDSEDENVGVSSGNARTAGAAGSTPTGGTTSRRPSPYERLGGAGGIPSSPKAPTTSTRASSAPARPRVAKSSCSRPSCAIFSLARSQNGHCQRTRRRQY